MTNRIDRLVDRGLVERLPHPSDRRGVRVRLRPEGRDLAASALRDLLALEERVLAGLDAARRDDMADTAAPALGALRGGLIALE